MFTDEETCSFVQEQKRAEFYDLKHALHVMDRLETQLPAALSRKHSSLSRKSSIDPPSPLLSSQQNPSIPAPQQEIKSPQTLISTHLPTRSMTESHLEHRTLTQSYPRCTPRDFVTIFLLENRRLLSTSVNQMKLEEQVRSNAGFSRCPQFHIILVPALRVVFGPFKGSLATSKTPRVVNCTPSSILSHVDTPDPEEGVHTSCDDPYLHIILY